jgi:plasmid stability protein
MSQEALVLRTVYLSADLDEKLRLRAFNNRTSKNELIRGYLEAALKAETSRNGTSLNKVTDLPTASLRNELVGQHSSRTIAKKASARKIAMKKAASKKVASKKAASKKK